MKITLPTTPAKLATYALLAGYLAVVAVVAFLLFDPELADERSNPAYLVTPVLTGFATFAWLFFLRPMSARLNGTVLTVSRPRNVKQIDLATIARVSLDDGPVLVLHLDEGESAGDSIRVPLTAAKDAEREAITAALDGNDQPAARDTAARLRMPRV